MIRPARDPSSPATPPPNANGVRVPLELGPSPAPRPTPSAEATTPPVLLFTVATAPFCALVPYFAAVDPLSKALASLATLVLAAPLLVLILSR